MARLALWFTSFSLLMGAMLFGIRLLGGYFLADDFSQLAAFGHWERQGTLGAEVMARFAGSIDGVNGFWRPLTFATYALNYLVNRADASGGFAKADVEQALGAAIDFEVVSDGRLVLSSNNEGVAFVTASADAPIAQDVRRIADTIVARQADRAPALARR